MKQKAVDWWKPTAQHMWRTFFAIESSSPDWDALPQSEKNIHAICNHIFRTRFVKTDQDILRTYFTSRWGDDLYTVEDYSIRHNIPTKVIWMVIKRANRNVIETLGILERKDGTINE